MTLKTNPILNIPVYKETKTASQIVSDTDIVLYDNTLQDNIDTFKNKIPKEQITEKKKRKNLIIAGIGIGLAASLFIICKGKNWHLEKSLYKETKKFHDFDNFKKISMFKNMDEEDARTLCEQLKLDRHFLNVFLGTATGVKSACWIDIPLELTKCQFPSKIDVCVANWGGTYMFNQEKTLKTITKNKHLFTERLGLPKETDVHKIYEIILENCGKEAKNADELSQIITQHSDLLGILVSYSKRNAMVWELEEILNGVSAPPEVKEKLRKNPKELSKRLLEILHSPKSPYKGLDQKEIEELEKALKKMRNPYKVKVSYPQITNSLFGHLRFVDDPEEFKRIDDAAKSYLDNFKIENYWKQPEKMYELQSFRSHKISQWKDYWTLDELMG